MPTIIEIERHDVLEQARFALVQARVQWATGQHSCGWGRDGSLDIATDKAICEAVERFCQTQLPATRWAPASALSQYVDPNVLISYEPWQYQHPGFRLMPFDRDSERCWVSAQRVQGKQASLVLAECVCSPRAFDATYRNRLVTHASTSGCASAFELGDAILRATLELIERDAFMRHWFAQRPGRAISLATLPDRLRGRLEVLVQAGCAVGVQCLLMGAHPTWLVWAQHPLLGFTSIGSASGIEGGSAIDTALNELETQALARAAGVPSEPVTDSIVRSPADHAALYATQAYFRRADALWYGASATWSFDDACAVFASTPEQVFTCAEQAGHALYWVDLTPPEARDALKGRTIHTVKAIGTGLIPMCFGYAQSPLGMDRWHRVEPLAVHPFA